MTRLALIAAFLAAPAFAQDTWTHETASAILRPTDRPGAVARQRVRPIRIDGNVAYVTLSRGYEAVIDAADVPLVEGYNWSAVVCPNAVYAAHKLPKDQQGNARTILMHRVIMGDPKGLYVDHVDRDALNNRRHNLRTATRSQNQHNRRKCSKSVSGLKGVHWDQSRQKWNARIMLHRRSIYLGAYLTPEAAHAAYCEASARLHGEFGRVE